LPFTSFLGSGGGIVVWPAGPARARVFTASVPGGVITASQTGSGAPVLLLHGGPGLSDYTAPLTADFWVCRPPGQHDERRKNSSQQPDTLFALGD
jgi:pimeloyl-ACP methyl ester carboxylesterase